MYLITVGHIIIITITVITILCMLIYYYMTRNKYSLPTNRISKHYFYLSHDDYSVTRLASMPSRIPKSSYYYHLAPE